MSKTRLPGLGFFVGEQAYAHNVELMRQLRQSGSTLQSIADRLNAEGERTAQGNLWSSVAAMRVLQRW